MGEPEQFSTDEEMEAYFEQGHRHHDVCPEAPELAASGRVVLVLENTESDGATGTNNSSGPTVVRLEPVTDPTG